MKPKRGLAVALLLATAGAAEAQIPESLDGRLLFTLAGAPAGHEAYRIQRTVQGYRLTGDVTLEAMGISVVQHLDVETGPLLAFRHATVQSTVNGESSTVRLDRDGGFGVQKVVQGDSTVSSRMATPAASVLLTNNAIHHIAQFAWLHRGGMEDTTDLIAFPRVPVRVVWQSQRRVTRDGRTVGVRRYYLNLANRLAAYVWLAEDGRPLKISVPLQAFLAMDEEYRNWSEALALTATEPADTVREDKGYNAEEVRFVSDGVRLGGTLTLPRGPGPWPAAVLISGSGAQDRDENTPGPGGLKLGIFRSVAEALTFGGIAVLRYDDRGVGASGGDLSTAGLSDLVADVRAAVRALRGRKEVDAGRIALVGHSEGAIIAPIVAAEDPEIAAVVLMAGPATPLDSVLIEQVVGAAKAVGGDSAAVADARNSVLELLRAVRENRPLTETDLPPAYRALGTNQKWLREHLEHDPLATIQSVEAPVLIVNGGDDIQVAPEHARRLGDALADAGHPDYEVMIFPRLNHLFAVSRGEGGAEYTDPGVRVDPAFLDFLASWLAERLGTTPP